MALGKALGGGGGGGGSAITLKDEGSTLTAGLTSLDVVGAGATASVVGTAGTLTIPGATQYPVWSPHKPPASANALDVEFVGSSSISSWPAGWTASAGGDFPNPIYPNTDAGRFSATDAAGSFKGRIATVPAGDFNLAAYLSANGPASTYTLAYIGVNTTSTITQSANNALFYVGYHGALGGWGLGVETNGGFVGSFGGSNHLILSGVVVWIRRVGSNYFFGWSEDGLRGHESGAVALVGITKLSVGAYSTQNGYSIVRWVRVITSSGARQSWGGLV